MRKHIFFNKINSGLLLLFFLTAFTSCKKFLVEEPVSNISANFVYTTEEGLQSAVVALYNTNRSLYENGEWNYAMAVLLQAKSDLALTRSGEISLFGTLTWGSSLSDFGTTRYDNWWKTYYKIVLRANAIIQSAPQVQDMDDSARAEILAEAKCWRAFSYFTLYRLFHNIYITTDPTTPENAFDIIDKASPEDSIYGLINSDLDYAINHLPWTVNSGSGRITQGVARTIKSKVALWQKDWQEAKEQAEAIIESGHYTLMENTADV